MGCSSWHMLYQVGLPAGCYSSPGLWPSSGRALSLKTPFEGVPIVCWSGEARMGSGPLNSVWSLKTFAEISAGLTPLKSVPE